MTGEDKIVLLLSSLPPHVVEPILSRMAPAEATRIRARLQQPPPTGLSVGEVAREFSDITRIVTRAVAAPAPQPTPPPAVGEPSADPVVALRECPPEILSVALQSERPPTIALTLGFLDVERASATL